jgi:ribosomal protein L9
MSAILIFIAAGVAGAAGFRHGGLRTPVAYAARASCPLMKMKGRAGFAKKRQLLTEDALAGNPRHRFEAVGGKLTSVKLTATIDGLGAAGDVLTVKPSYASFLIAGGKASQMKPGMLQRSRKQHRVANETEEERDARAAKLESRRREGEEEAGRWAAERNAVAAAAAAEGKGKAPRAAEGLESTDAGDLSERSEGSDAVSEGEGGAGLL